MKTRRGSYLDPPLQLRPVQLSEEGADENNIIRLCAILARESKLANAMSRFARKASEKKWKDQRNEAAAYKS